MAIYDLTKENLKKLGYAERVIESLLVTKHEKNAQLNLNYASIEDRKIYSEEDFYLLTYNGLLSPAFPRWHLKLIPEYFTACLQKHLKKRFALLGKAFIESAEIEAFITAEIRHCDDYIEPRNELFKNRPELLEKNSTVIGYTAYKRWLLNQNVNQFKISNEVEKENVITYNVNDWSKNTFELFKYLHENYTKSGNIKYINIYYFLRNHCIPYNLNNQSKHDYSFTFKINRFKDWVDKNFNIKITKFAKARYDFENNQLPILNQLKQSFESKFKKIE